MIVASLLELLVKLSTLLKIFVSVLFRIKIPVTKIKNKIIKNEFNVCLKLNFILIYKNIYFIYIFIWENLAEIVALEEENPLKEVCL
jgi:hypothetical protein